MVDQVAKKVSVGERVFKEHLGGTSGLGKEKLSWKILPFVTLKQEPKCNEHQFCECN